MAAVTVLVAVGVTLNPGGAASPSPPAARAHPVPVGYAGPAVGITESPSPFGSTGSQQFTSRNWDGYITYLSSEGTDFNSVAATWVQPTVTCEAAGAWTVLWVGLDGWYNDTVEQGGSSAECGAAGSTATYSLWWEMYPTVAIQKVLTIKAGDTVRASVVYATLTKVFTITVKDITTGQFFIEHELCASGLTCQRSSADVITEDVGHFGANTFFPLANYGTMLYAAAHIVDKSGVAGTISGSGWLNAAVTESSGGIKYASVSPLSPTGGAFNAIWHHQ